jgi:hypothetical protein
MAPIYAHWAMPPAWWTEGAMVWYFWGHYHVHIHTRYADGSITFALYPVEDEPDGPR